MDYSCLPFVELELISEMGNLKLYRSEFVSCRIPRQLYSDMWIKPSALPHGSTENILCALMLPNDIIHLHNSKILSLLCNDLLICQCYEETSQCVYMIYFCNVSNLNSLVLAKYEFAELWSSNELYSNQISEYCRTRVKEIAFKSNFYETWKDYKKHFDDWVEYVKSQQKYLEGLNQELIETRRIQAEKGEEVKKKYEPAICKKCRVRQMNAVFLPCGHVALCTQCAIVELKLEVNTVYLDKKHQAHCIVCKRGIKELREIFF